MPNTATDPDPVSELLIPIPCAIKSFNPASDCITSDFRRM